MVPVQLSPFRRAGAALFLAGLSVTGLVAADWSDLMAKSPFGQAAAGPGDQAPTELEFRGMVVEGSTRLVNLYDPAAKTSRWVPVNATTQGLQVMDFDARTNQVKVVRDGRALTLPLKQAHVALLQAAPAPVGPAMNGPAGPDDNADAATREERRAEFRKRMRERMENGGPPPGPEEIPAEVRAIREEIRRRRALRDGTPPPAAPAPAPAGPTSHP